MRLNTFYLVILLTFLFSCQKNDLTFKPEPFYQRCTLESINLTETQKATIVKYRYDQNGELKYKLYKDLNSQDFIAIDTVLYLPNGMVGRIEYKELNNRALPISTYSLTYAGGKIERIFETGFLNNFPYVITYQYKFDLGRLSKIQKTGDLVNPNYTLDNFSYINMNMVGCQIQLENSLNKIDLAITTDNYENISHHLLPFPNAILFKSTLNNITSIKNVQPFDFNGAHYDESSILFKQDLVFTEQGALKMALENNSVLPIFSDGPALKNYNYTCE